MTTIRATCPRCGEVELTAAQVSLDVCANAPLSSYAFRCPVCQQDIRKPADDHVVSLLVTGGVSVDVWEIPAEALEERSGAPIGYDDLLDFALQLAIEDDLSWLAGPVVQH